MLRIVLALLAFLLLSPAVSARECTANINGTLVRLSYSDVEYFNQKTSIRDLVTSRTRGLCPGYTILRHLTPKLTDKQREVFCLNYDSKSAFYRGIAQGSRDAYGVCATPGKICEFVKEQKDAALALTGLAAGTSGGATAAATAAGVTAVTHSSGAVILTGSAGYIGGTLGTLGAGALSILTAPVVVAGTAVSLVGVGSAVYLCR